MASIHNGREILEAKLRIISSSNVIYYEIDIHAELNENIEPPQELLFRR